MSDLRKGALCPACEKGQLRVTKKDLLFTYKDQSKKFKKEKVYQCDLCDYEALNKQETQRVDRILTDFRRCIDGLLTSDQLCRIRESLGRNKKSMAKLLSVNPKTIGRYENGKITQSEQIDKLYRIIGALPAAVRILDSRKGIYVVHEPKKTRYNLRLTQHYHLTADNYSILDGARHGKAA